MFVNAVSQETELLQEADFVPCVKPDIETNAENVNNDCEIACGGDSYNAKERNSTIPLPAQTVAALSENLPWDPEGDASSCSETNHLGENPHIIHGLEIPVVKEQLVADVRPKKETGSDIYSRGNDKMSHCVGGSSSEFRDNTLSPDLDGFSGDVGKSWNDRGKRSTIRRINWETNFIPPVDFIESRTSLQRHLQKPVQTSQQIGKETSV